MKRIFLAGALLAPLLAACGGDADTRAIANIQAEDNNGQSNNGSGQDNNGDANNGDANNGDANNGQNNGEQPVGGQDGDACAQDADCAGGRCLGEGDGFPGGMCTTEGCATGVACHGESQCAFLDAERQNSACFARCGEQQPCREGYACNQFGDTAFCLPEAPEPVEPQPDGSPCASREECEGGVCLTEAEGFPGGMCTTVGCRNRQECSSGGAEDIACLVAAQPTYCVQLCERQSDCRQGYICQPVQGAAYCTPSPTAGTFVPEEGDLPFALVCGDTLAQADAFQGGLDLHQMSFTVPEDTTSLMVVPYSPGGQIYPVALENSGGRLDMFQDYNFALANAGFLINVTPLLIPQAPQFAGFVRGGQYTLDMAADQDLCHYVLPKSGRGSQIDLNFYFVGAAGLNADNAGSHQRFQRSLEVFDEIYSQSGANIRNIRYQDITGADATRYRVVRSQEAAFRLVSLGQAPGDTQDELLSINVYFIDDFAIQGGSVLGISAGLPGAAGFHGGRGSGLVFSAAVLGDPDLLGQVLAHEVGHYLGLFHTTEQGGRGQDPLDDTPACSPQQWNNPARCPDITNLMFPFAGNDHMTLTRDQGDVIHANPLVK